MLHRSFSLASCCAAAVLLVGCASSDGIAPHEHLTPAGSLDTDASLAGIQRSAAAWPATDWWTHLGDPRLDQLVQEALHDNPTLAMATARARAADATSGSLRAELLPSVSGNASITGDFAGMYGGAPSVPPPPGRRFAWLKAAYLNFQWDLDLWGGNRAAWEAAVGQAVAAEVDVHAARLLVSTDLARAYASLGYAFRQQQLAEEELQRARHARDLTKQRFDAGISNRLDVKRSDTEVEQDERALAATRQTVDAARIELAQLLGKGPDRGLAIARPETLQPTQLTLPSDLRAGLLARRPDIVAARWRVEAAQRNIQSAKARFLPNISLSALLGFSSAGSETLFQLPARFLSAGPLLGLPIFEGGRLRANLKGADAAYDLATADYNQTLIAAVNQVANLVKALESLQRQIGAQQQALDSAQTAWDLSEQRFKSGIGSFLEALGTRRDLLQAEQALAALQAEQVDVSIQLIQALGGGWQAGDAQATPTAAPATPVALSAQNKNRHE